MSDTNQIKKAQTTSVPSDANSAQKTSAPAPKAAAKAAATVVKKEPAKAEKKEPAKAEKSAAKETSQADTKAAKAPTSEKNPAKAKVSAGAKASVKAAASKGKRANGSGVKGVRAQAKYIRVAPRKARLVVDLIRNKSVDQANEILQFSTRAVATDVEKVLRSACANAFQNNGLRTEDLVISEAYVDEGPTLKRIRPRAKGSASRINKRTSHITVVVVPRKEAKA